MSLVGLETCAELVLTRVLRWLAWDVAICQHNLRTLGKNILQTIWDAAWNNDWIEYGIGTDTDILMTN